MKIFNFLIRQNVYLIEKIGSTVISSGSYVFITSIYSIGKIVLNIFKVVFLLLLRLKTSLLYIKNNTVTHVAFAHRNLNKSIKRNYIWFRKILRKKTRLYAKNYAKIQTTTIAKCVYVFNEFKNILELIFNKAAQLAYLLRKLLNRKLVYYTMLVVVPFILAFITINLLHSVPNPTTLSDFSLPASTQIFDRNGIILYSAYSNVNRLPIKYQDMPQSFIDASVAAEDKAFYNHNGFDLIRIVKVAMYNISHKDIQGASTITQQLAKNIFLTNEQTFSRKIKEAIITMRIEHNFSKQQILELYFNTISYGGNTIGVESAAERYFGKKAHDLTKKESIFLASLPVAPSVLLNSSQNKLTYQVRMQYIVKQLVEMKKISEKDGADILSEKMNILPAVAYKRAPAFVDYILSKLQEKYGSEYIYNKGLLVHTSLDLKLQNFSQQTVIEQITKYKTNNVNNGALLIINPHNGDILSMVGSANYYDPNGGQYNVVISPRQLGSAVKLLTYTEALEKKYTANSLLADKQRYYKEFPDYIPHNYDGKEHGTITLKQAFANSYNLPALSLGYDIGLKNIADLGGRMGISELSNKKNIPLSMILGGVEMTLEHLTHAYGVVANGGKSVNIDPFLKITNYDGEVLYEKQNIQETQIVSSSTSKTIFEILSDPNARMAMFGHPQQFDFQDAVVALKTGTSNDAKDNTAFAFTKNFVVGSWIGNNDNSPMTDISSGYVGATSIMHDVTMLMLHDGDEKMITRNEKITN